MKKCYTLVALSLITLLMMASCSSESDTPKRRPIPEVAEQSVLFYMTGHSLQSYFRHTNLPEIRKAIDNDILYDSRVFVHIQSGGISNETLLLELYYDYTLKGSNVDTLRRYIDCNTIQSSHIKRVSDDIAQIAPAKRYGLVLGSHGGAWVPAKYKNLADREPTDDNQSGGWSTTTQNENFDLLYKSEGAEPTRWFGEYMGYIAENSVWIEAFESDSIDFDYIIFDACFMSNIESLYEFRNSADYIVGSPCEIMGRGIPYNIAVPYLFTNQGKDYDLLGFINSFVTSYRETTSTRKSGCMSLTVCSEIDALSEIVKEVYSRCVGEVDINSLQSYEGLSEPLFVDFEQYMLALIEEPELKERFVEQFNKTFPEEYRLRTDFFYSGFNNSYNVIDYYSGVTTSDGSIRFPTSYKACEWSRYVNPEE